MQHATGKQYDLLDFGVRRADCGGKVTCGDSYRALGRIFVSHLRFGRRHHGENREKNAGGPYPVTIGGETKHICGCGLSNTQPFCNGTPKITRQEDPNKLYWYDEQGSPFETTDSFQGIRCPQE